MAASHVFSLDGHLMRISPLHLVTSRSQLARCLLVRPPYQLRTHPVATGGESIFGSGSLASCPGQRLAGWQLPITSDKETYFFFVCAKALPATGLDFAM